MDRIGLIEDQLDVKILNPVDNGTSLEKYHAVFEEQEVMLRIYSENYYSDRFLREGIALRNIYSSNDIDVPSIIEEWPEHQVRAIKWYNFEDRKITHEQTNDIFTWLGMQKGKIPYSLEDDLYHHLTQLEETHPAYRSLFEQHIQKHWDCINWNEIDPVIVHGDFHLDNMSITGDKIILYDWEYATYGSPLYDRAYYEIYHQRNPTTPISWQFLVTTAITHWFAQEVNFSPKDVIYWIDRLAELASSC